VVVGGTPVLVHNKCPDGVPYGPKMNYKANPKHRNGVLGTHIGPEPTRGQEMLDRSRLVNSTSGRRVAYDRDNGEIVIIPKTGGATCHGYVTLWSNTPDDVRGVLTKQGVFNDKGKLQKGWKR
jgi:hypothetical protein